jgi:hypothetical protein
MMRVAFAVLIHDPDDTDADEMPPSYVVGGPWIDGVEQDT